MTTAPGGIFTIRGSSSRSFLSWRLPSTVEETESIFFV